MDHPLFQFGQRGLFKLFTEARELLGQCGQRIKIVLQRRAFLDEGVAFFAFGFECCSSRALLRYRFSNLRVNRRDRLPMSGLERLLLPLQDGPPMHQFST